ncbi:MAG: HAMP domain-containing sensor histidine kinase [Coriobacteriia bacterium]|nr:HAMP domain-containing sensor histidine kinase [Coriobacteriia bacterium]
MEEEKDTRPKNRLRSGAVSGRDKASDERILVSAEGEDPDRFQEQDEEEPEKRSWELPRWSSMNMTSRLSIMFGLIAAMTAVVAFLVLSVVWEQHFQSYTRENLQETATTIASRLAEAYEEEGMWTKRAVEPASYVNVVYPGTGVMLVDRYGHQLYDSTAEKGVREQYKAYLAPSSEDRMRIANVVVDDQVVGSVRVWVYGSDSLLRQSDVLFKENSYQAMLAASLFAIILAVICGCCFARNLVRPINTMTRTAEAIKEGDLKARTELRGEDELSQLGETFDAMAESIENDRNLERRLTTDVAHELRTPLMAIQATVEAMVDGVFEPNEEHLETVNSEVQRLSRLVDSLLKLSRLENRSNPLKTQIVDVGDLVDGIVGTHEAFVAESGLELHSEVEHDVYVKGDPDMIRQATANLISNAVRYTPEGGHIWVRVRRGEIMASISVEDTGIGLTPEEAKMVFARFWRADAGRTRERGGLGIGLSVVKEIVERHGGWVQVEGEKDEGARFTIHIPLYSEEREKAQRAKDAKARKGGRAARSGKIRLSR